MPDLSEYQSTRDGSDTRVVETVFLDIRYMKYIIVSDEEMVFMDIWFIWISGNYIYEMKFISDLSDF